MSFIGKHNKKRSKVDLPESSTYKRKPQTDSCCCGLLGLFSKPVEIKISKAIDFKRGAGAGTGAESDENKSLLNNQNK